MHVFLTTSKHKPPVKNCENDQKFANLQHDIESIGSQQYYLLMACRFTGGCCQIIAQRISEVDSIESMLGEAIVSRWAAKGCYRPTVKSRARAARLQSRETYRQRLEGPVLSRIWFYNSETLLEHSLDYLEQRPHAKVATLVNEICYQFTFLARITPS